MSRFPDFMHMDLSKLTCSGCFLIVLSFVVAIGTAVGGALLVNLLFPGALAGRRDRWLMGLLLIGGLAVGGGFFQLGSFVLKQLGLRLYRNGQDPAEESKTVYRRRRDEDE
jgi:hypothetical protein